MRARYGALFLVVWSVGCDAYHERGVEGARDSGVTSVDAGATVERDASEPAVVDAGQQPDAAIAPVTLCDGSSDIRLVWQLDDQIMGFSYPFTVPYGSAIIVVDGKCRFHASRDHRAGYTTGALSAEQASELSRDLAVAELMKMGNQSYYPAGGCVDIPALVVTTSAGAVRCGCACPSQTPKAIADALQDNASRWLQRLLDQGEPLTPSVVSAVAVPLTAGSPVVAGGPKAWPLQKSMDEVPNLKLTGLSDPRWNKGPYARIDASNEITALRPLREADIAANTYRTEGAQVTDGKETYRLFVRDELPEDFASALHAFLARPKMH